MSSKRRDVLRAVRSLTLDPESRAHFRKRYVEAGDTTLLLGNKDAMEYYISFAVMPVPIFMLQPLPSFSIYSTPGLHYCLGRLYTRLSTNRDINFDTGFLATKAFLSGSGNGLWIVQDSIYRYKPNALPQHRVDRLGGELISCAQLRDLAPTGQLALKSRHDAGFLFLPLRSCIFSEMPPLLNPDSGAMDEWRFQELYYTKLQELLWRHETRQQREEALRGHLTAEELPKFLDRYEKGPRWRDFGGRSMLDAVRSIDVDSTNHELRRVIDQLYSEGEAGRSVRITCPDGITRSYAFIWASLPESCLEAFDEDWPTTERLKQQARLLGLVDAEEGDLAADEVVETDRYWPELGTVVEVATPSSSAIALPFGYLIGDDRNNFIVVRLLESAEFGIVFCSWCIDLDLGEEARVPHRRVANFPGTNTPVSTGVLKGLFDTEIATLEQIESDGYRIRRTVRLGGKIQKCPVVHSAAV